MRYFALAMSALYVLAGAVFLFTDSLHDIIPNYRPLIGAVLAGYGLVRFFMWWRKYSSGEQA